MDSSFSSLKPDPSSIVFISNWLSQLPKPESGINLDSTLPLTTLIQMITCHVNQQTCPLLTALFAIIHPPGEATIIFHLDCCKACQLVLLAPIHSPQQPAGPSKRETGPCHFLPYFPSIVLRVKSSHLNVVYKAFHDFSSLRSSFTILGSSPHICQHPHSYPPDRP